MNIFEKLDENNRLLINFAYYEEMPNGTLQDSYFEKLDDVLADGFIDGEMLGEARNLIERLSEIIKITSDRVEFRAKVEMNKLKIVYR
jgi:hypothetical protein